MENTALPITPIQVKKIYEKHGFEISLEQAKKILEFLDKFAQLAVQTYVKQL